MTFFEPSQCLSSSLTLQYNQLFHNTLTKLIADLEIKKKQMEEREHNERKRQRETEEETEAKAKREKEWKKEWEVSHPRKLSKVVGVGSTFLVDRALAKIACKTPSQSASQSPLTAYRCCRMLTRWWWWVGWGGVPRDESPLSWSVVYFVPSGIQDRACRQLEGLSAERLKEEEEESSWHWRTQTSKVKARETITDQ